MKNIKKRALSMIVAAATVLSVGVASFAIPGAVFVPNANIVASAANELGYINVSGEYKTRENYSEITSTSTRLDGGWYVVYGNVTINGRMLVTDDTYIVLTDGCKLTVKGGIEVASGCKFNVYAQSNSAGSLYAGTTSGTNISAENGKCGIGGKGAKINLVGGNIHAVGGYNSYGIEGSDIHLYWTNPTDSIYASSFKGTVSCYNYFINKESGTICSKNTVISTGTTNGRTLAAAVPITKNSTYLTEGTYIVTSDVTVSDRIAINGSVSLFLGSGCTLRAYDGITVPKDATLRINGAYNSKLYAGTSNGSNFTADDNNAGIGSENGARTGSIIIKGGTVKASGGRNAAGIGGSSAYVEIESGVVSANGGKYGAGIGSGYNDNGAEVKILGGEINAVGGTNAGGIGSGCASNTSVITLGTSSSSDSIYASSFSGNIKFLNTLYTSDGQVANANNIAGKSLTSRITSYSITFDSNNGSYVAPITVKANGYVGTLPTPSKNGFTFGGWYTDKNCYYEFNRNTPINQNYTLYAKWNSASHTISFNSNGGTSVRSMTVVDGDYMYTPASPTRNGYIFNGWYLDKNCQNLFHYETTRIYNDMTLYAGWTPAAIYHTVTFDTNGGTYMGAMSVLNNDYMTNPGTPGRDGYAFTGWYTNKACTAAFYWQTTRITRDMTLYAGWTPLAEKCTISFVTNGGRAVNAMSVDKGTTIYSNELPATSIPGSNYSFTGWYEDAGCTVEVYSLYVDRNKTLYAGFEENTIYHDVVFDAGAGQFYDGTKRITYQVEHGTSVNYCPFDPSYTYDGVVYEFEGWYYDGAGNRPYAGEPINSNITLYASYSAAYGYEVGSTFNGAGLIGIIAGGVALAGGGLAAGIAIGKKKK